MAKVVCTARTPALKFGSRFALVLGHYFTLGETQHIKQVPGRKTDVKDCEWIADLLHGSLEPNRPQRELRELVRYRTALLQERSVEVNGLQKTLEGANIKLASVATDIRSWSGREIVAALVSGVTDAVALADLAKGKLRAKFAQLEQAPSWRFAAHQRFLIARQVAYRDYPGRDDRAGQCGDRDAPAVA